MYSPIELSNKIEKIVIKENKKKYYRYRSARFYGGVSTADTVGCNLRCKFCWSGNSIWNADKTGKFYSPNEVAENLINIAELKRFNYLRISGGEPTIGKKHLIEVLEKINDNFLFILETNGILLGLDKSYIEELSKFKNLHIRVCIKGADDKEFSFLTGASSGYEYQLKSLEYLSDTNIMFNVALVSLKNNKNIFYEKLTNMCLEKIMLEEEVIKLYPQVKNRLKKEGIIKYFL
jgi:uncharacterized Fe-S cluster-containing radical SAM superfamily protein